MLRHRLWVVINLTTIGYIYESLINANCTGYISNSIVEGLIGLAHQSLVVTLAASSNNAIPTKVEYSSRLYWINTVY